MEGSSGGLAVTGRIALPSSPSVVRPPSGQQLFRRFLRDYPYLPSIAVFRAIEIRHVLSQPFPPGQGLDLGCGDGVLMRVILEHVGPRDIVGVDPDEHEIALAEQLGVYAQLFAVPGQSIPLPSGNLDWVFSNSVLEHIDEIDGVLREVSRVLRPGGVFLFTVPASGFHAALRGPMLPWVRRQAYLEYLDRRVIHLRYWSEADWQSRLEPLGLRIERTTRYMTRNQLRRWETLNRISGTIVYALFGRRRSPVAIQRALGLRRSHRQTPSAVLGLLAGVVGVGVAFDEEPREPQAGTCLMILARKTI